MFFSSLYYQPYTNRAMFNLLRQTQQPSFEKPSRNPPEAFEEHSRKRCPAGTSLGLLLDCRTIAEEMFDVRCMM